MELQTIKRGSRNTDAVIVLQELLVREGLDLTVDGGFGSGTERAVREFQRHAGLVVDGIVGPKSWAVLVARQAAYFAEISTRFLSEQDLTDEAATLDIELAALKAVNEVESQGIGFLGGRPKILFEGHVFWKCLKEHGIDPQGVREGNEDILYPRWTTEHYLGGVREYERLERAAAVNEEAALESASWGLFQIMGFNYAPAGFDSVFAFVAAQRRHERDHLRAFGAFITDQDLVQPLREKDWKRFARSYNGKDFAEHDYDGRLARAYARYRDAA